MEDKWNFIILGIILLFVIGIVICLIVFKDRIFNAGKHLGDKAKSSPEELKAKGYGTYYKAYESPCITTDGKCITAGIKYITEYCAPHEETKNGCINELGELSFASQTRNELCQTNCRSYVLREITNDRNICQYDPPYNTPAYTCVPANAQMYEYRNYECIKNDSIGDNTCTYQCSQSGIDSAGLAGDADRTKPSYIPACDPTLPNYTANKTITLNSLNYKDIHKIGNDPTKGNLSKGYHVSNTYFSDRTVNPLVFNISPPYPPWSSNPSNLISYEDLILLDSTLTVYDNCISSGQKPLCENWYYAKPISVVGENSGLTFQRQPELCTLDGAFSPISECFYTPWYNPLPSDGSTGVNFVNPYTGGASGPNTIGGTGAVYSWVGIGNYGYYTTPLLCETTPKNFIPSVNGPAGSYVISGGDTGAACLNLSAPPRQCSNGFPIIKGTNEGPVQMFPVTPSQNLQTLINDFDLGNYNPQIVGEYPATQGDTYYTCNTQYTNKIINNNPGCIQTCQYVPNIDEGTIDFNSPDRNGNYLNTELRDIIGSYLILKIKGIEGDSFLGTQNVPCKNLSNQGVPLMNCLRIEDSPGITGAQAEYYPTPCAFIYSGGTGIDAGNFWSKNGCDSESIIDASVLRLIISPDSIYGVIGSGNTGNSILCDIYGEIDGNFGYLSPYQVSNNINAPSLNISSYFNYNNTTNLGNIVANNNIGSTGSTVYFNALDKGQPIPYTVNNSKPNFIITYDSSTSTYNVSSSNSYFSNIGFDLYIGSVYTPYTPGGIAFSFTNENNIVPFSNVPFYTKLEFNEPIIKTEDLYVGYDVSRTINLQRINPCYTKKMCSGGLNPTPSGNTGVCYESTCNLYFNYNPEFC